MKFLRWAALAALVGCHAAPVTAEQHGYEQMIHFVCDTVDEAEAVAHLVPTGELTYAVSPLPGNCFWTRGRYEDMWGMVGIITEIIKGVNLDNGDVVWIGAVEMPNGDTGYSAGFVKIG